MELVGSGHVSAPGPGRGAMDAHAESRPAWTSLCGKGTGEDGLDAVASPAHRTAEWPGTVSVKGGKAESEGTSNITLTVTGHRHHHHTE